MHCTDRALHAFIFVHHAVFQHEPDFSRLCAGPRAAHFPKNGSNCRVARQKLPLPGICCPAITARRQIPPGRFFRRASKSMVADL
jgi:hypothetical protein